MKSRTKRVTPRANPRPAMTESGETQEVVDDVDDRICATIAAAISEGALKPGTKILEDVIADHFGVSRTVVRGALGILQRDHLLERKRNRGTFVAEPSIEDAKQLFETRRLMERTIIELVVQRAQAADLDHLTDIAEDEKRIHAGSNEPLKTGLSGQFHVEMAKVSGNGVLTELLGKVVSRLSLVMALYEEDHSDECGADHHLAIIGAIRKKDVAKAQALMDEHLADIEGRVRLTQNQGDRHSFESVLATFSRQ